MAVKLQLTKGNIPIKQPLDLRSSAESQIEDFILIKVKILEALFDAVDERIRPTYVDPVRLAAIDYLPKEI